MLSHVNLEMIVDEVELDNEHDELSTIFGVLEHLFAIDFETERDALRPISVELAVRLEILCEIVALEVYGILDKQTNLANRSTLMWAIR